MGMDQEFYSYLFGIVAMGFVTYFLIYPPRTHDAAAPVPKPSTAPPPWVGKQYRCPNCSCKWCVMGAQVE